jgi:uncharacterized protein (UPF0212 family)
MGCPNCYIEMKNHARGTGQRSKIIPNHEEANMMEARLGVTTCEKCKKPMKEGQLVFVTAERNVVHYG